MSEWVFGNYPIDAADSGYKILPYPTGSKTSNHAAAVGVAHLKSERGGHDTDRSTVGAQLPWTNAGYCSRLNPFQTAIEVPAADRRDVGLAALGSACSR